MLHVFVCCNVKAPLELGTKSSSICYGLRSHAGFFIFVLCFWSYSRMASATWKLAHTLCLTKLKPKQNHRLFHVLVLIFFLLFPNKTSLPSQRRLGLSFGWRPQGEAKDARGSAGIVVGSWTRSGSAEPYHMLALPLKCIVLLLQFSHAIKKRKNCGLKDFRALSWKVCFSVFAELQWDHLHCTDCTIQIGFIIVPHIFETVARCYPCGSTGVPLQEWQLTNAKWNNGCKCGLDWNNIQRVNGHHY